MSLIQTSISQDILPAHLGPRRLPIHRHSAQDLSRAAQAIIGHDSDVLGLSLELSDKGQAKALAFSTTKEVHYISFDISARGRGKQMSSDSDLSDLLSGRCGLLAGFSMARIALHMHRELGYHVSGVDLSTLCSPSTRCPWYPAEYLSNKVVNDVDRFGVNGLWYSDRGDQALERVCLRAWISAICAGASKDSIHDARVVDTTNMSKAQLTCLNSIVLTVHQLEAVKPMKTENEFHAIRQNKSGKLVLQNSRYKTRVRPSAQTKVVMETSRGHRLVGQAVMADGKQTQIQLLKGKFHGNIKRISVLGREELTCAELARDEFILRLLRKEVSLPVHAINVPGPQFIEMLWFPKKKTPQRCTLSHVSPLSTAFMDLNDSQRQVVAAMISTTEPLVIAHGPPGTGKTTTIAAAVDYWQRESQPVWIIAQSNVGVKNIARSFAKKQSIDFKLIVSKEFYVEWHEDLYDQVKHNLIRSDDLARIEDRIETERTLAGSQVILCTLSMLSNPVLDEKGVYGLVPMERLVVDEASQISVSEYMHLFHKFTKLEKMCFFGDPNQLPPYGREDAPGMQSIFDIKHLKSGSYFLDTQYRMPTPLGNFISDEVYDKRLKSVHRIHEISCVSFVDVDKGTEKRCGKSWTNTEEVHVVVNLVRYYYHNQPFVVITPYDAQRVAIQNALEKANLPSNCVYNVDSFQGHEKEFVIVSTVRTSKPGFLSSTSRNNVMLSRPTTGMIIVTNRHFLASSGRQTLVGKLCEWWARLAADKDCIWTNWRQTADQTADMPGVPAPKQKYATSVVVKSVPASTSVVKSIPPSRAVDMPDLIKRIRKLGIVEVKGPRPQQKATSRGQKDKPLALQWHGSNGGAKIAS